MPLFKKEIDELHKEMDKLKIFITDIKNEVAKVEIEDFTVTGCEELREMYKQLETCCQLLDMKCPESNKFSIPDDLVTPDFLRDDPISTLIGRIDHLKRVKEFLIKFKEDVENIPEVPQIPKQVVSQPKTIKPLRLPVTEISLEASIVLPIIINHPDPPTVPERRRSIDRKLLSDDFVVFNEFIPDDRVTEGIDVNTKIADGHEKAAEGHEKAAETHDKAVEVHGTAADVLAKATEEYLHAGGERSKAAEEVTKNESKEYDISQIRHNIPPAGDSSIIKAYSIEDYPEIRNQSNIIQQPIVELPVPELSNIDQDPLATIQDINQPHRTLRTRNSTSLSENACPEYEITSRPNPLKKSKLRKFRYQFILQPQPTEYQIPQHYFDFQFNVHTQALIDMILQRRSNIQPRILQVSFQRDAIDAIQGQFEEMKIIRSPNVLQPPPPDQQSEIQFPTLIEQQPSISVDLVEQISIPVVDSIIKSRTDQSNQLLQIPDTSSSILKEVVTPKKINVNLSPEGKSVQQISKRDTVSKLNGDQYDAFCVLREIQQKYSLSNEIPVKKIQSHFGSDRIRYCKLIRIIIDLQCFDLIRIVKKDNEICGIEMLKTVESV